MNIKKSYIISALAVVIIGALALTINAFKLKGELEATKTEQDKLARRINGYEQLAEIDSLLLVGDYNTAIESYTTKIDMETEHKIGVPLRIAIAKKLQNERDGVQSLQNNASSKIDSLANSGMALSEEVRKFDSLNFSLEKTKVQLDRLKKQLQQKSFGEYLKFKSKKGNQMHYVGQVKDGQANGFGIALLDTGSRYEGEWKNNVRQGKGTFYWPDGEIYKGDYNNDKRSGFGTYFWPNGEKYSGDWKDDKRSGTGKFFNEKGEVVAEGEWDNDKLVDVN